MLVREAGLVVTEFSRMSVPVCSTELGLDRGDVDDQVLEAVLRDTGGETYQFVVKTVRDDGTKSLENLSDELVWLPDELHHESRRLAELRAKYEEPQENYGTDLRDLPQLRDQLDTVRRLLPMPLVRLAKRVLGQR